MQMTVRDTLYIDGELVRSGGHAIPVVNPATEEVIGSAPEATPADVDRAVLAARCALGGWAATPLATRIELVERIGTGLAARADEIGTMVARETGTPVALAAMFEGHAAAASVAAHADAARAMTWEERLENSLVVREPAGVVAAITPGNFPLSEPIIKLVPALMAGCTVVVKPSEVAPLAPFVLAELADAAGLPPGVLNIVTGGSRSGEALVAHPGVDMVSLTGSTEVGRRVAALAAPTLKRLMFELGGKSAAIVLDDADLCQSVAYATSQCLMNSGQVCISWSRMLVPRERQDEAAAIARATAESYAVGDPLAEGTVLGPLASAAQRERVRHYISAGIEEGATLVTGGPTPPPGLERGYFVRPTVFADVDNSMTIAREEIFGPVLSILPYDDEDDAVAIANDSIYGLHGAVFSADARRAERVARRLRTGGVDVNGGTPNLVAPVGGVKQSGYGREMGRAGIEEYLVLKSIQLEAV
jgi:acyl-CoA reductase-like NAD-dependent aldehyde dehydrogenase